LLSNQKKQYFFLIINIKKVKKEMLNIVVFFLFLLAIWWFSPKMKKLASMKIQPCFNRFGGIISDVTLQCPNGFEANPENGKQYQNLNSNKACRRMKVGQNPDYFPSKDYTNAHSCPHVLAKEKNINPNYLKSPTASTYNPSTSSLF
jgi:hypothetical protein